MHRWVFLPLGMYCFSKELETTKNFWLYPLVTSFLLWLIFGLQIFLNNFGIFDITILFMRGYRSFAGIIVAFFLIMSWLFQRNYLYKPRILFYFFVISTLTIASILADIAAFILVQTAIVSNLLNTFSSHLGFFYLSAHIMTVYVTLEDLRFQYDNIYTLFLSLEDNDLSFKAVQLVRQCREKFFDLNIIVQKISEEFAFRDLILVGHCFIVGVLTTYGAVSELFEMGSTGISLSTIVDLIVYAKWAIFSFFALMFLIWPYNTLTTKRRESIEVVHRVLGNPITKDVKQELYDYALQLLSIDANFSPYGCFTINNKLILSIAGALLSYLIVLIQFKVST